MTTMMNLIDMNKKEMDKVKSGCVWSIDNDCMCACAYADRGGAPSFTNYSTNARSGLKSPQCYRKSLE